MSSDEHEEHNELGTTSDVDEALNTYIPSHAAPSDIMSESSEDHPEEVLDLIATMSADLDSISHEEEGGSQSEQPEPLANPLDLPSAGPIAEIPLPEYSFPALELLKDGRRSDGDDSVEQEQSQILNRVFDEFKIGARVVSWKRGPRFTRFEIEAGRGLKVNSLLKYRDNFKYALGVDRVNVLAPIPGRKLIGIEISRKSTDADIVSLRDVLQSPGALSTDAPLLIGLGQDVDGTAVLADLAQMPHLLVAGATGSGKSCFINTLICSIIARSLRPDGVQFDVRFVLIDPKRVELAAYRGLPHLALPVVAGPENASKSLAWAVAEMEERLKLFERHRVKDIERYNKVGNAQSHRYPQDPNSIPRLVVVVDELADLMATTAFECEAQIIRLAQMGRAAGIHLVLATQRPTVEVVTGQIKNNITTRVAFATATQVDSRVILDSSGAETLAGEGDGLLSLNSLESMVRFQSAYIDEDEIEELVEFVTTQSRNVAEISSWRPQELELDEPLPEIDVLEEDIVDAEPEPAPPQVSLLAEAIGEVHVVTQEEYTASTSPEIQKTSALLQIADFVEPDWTEIVDLLDKRIEPCDLTGAMVEVSRKRHLARVIERALAHVRVRVMKRVADRAEYRFAEKIEQNESLNDLQDSLAEWHHEHSHSLAWQFNQQAIAQHDMAVNSRLEAIERVTSINVSNPDADKQYRALMRSIWLPTFFGLYIYSVLVLTSEKLHIFLKYFPIFNQNNAVLFVLVAGPVSFFILRGAWKYTSAVFDVDQRFIKANRDFTIYNHQIRHSYREEVRLQQQLRNIAPLLEVLARGYRSRWLSSDRLSNIEVSTELDTSRLPACFGFARAVEGSDDLMMRLRDLSLRQVIKPGWRTELIETLAVEYGKKKGQHLDYHHLDADLGYSAVGPRRMFLDALQDGELTSRLARQKLFRVVNEIHNRILRQKSSDLRPPVRSTRVNGFEGVSASSAWLSDATDLDDWMGFLQQILKEAPRFSYSGLSAEGRGMQINQGNVHSYATMPRYLEGAQHGSIQVEIEDQEVIAPIDIVVRVDVSDWADIKAFQVFDDSSDASSTSDIQQVVLSKESDLVG